MKLYLISYWPFSVGLHNYCLLLMTLWFLFIYSVVSMLCWDPMYFYILRRIQFAPSGSR